MSIKPIVSLCCGILLLSPFTLYADETKACNDKQSKRCGLFCSMHQSVKSCVVDITKRDGTCTCNDGISHTKSQ